jgi:hypothetical protein
VHLTSVHAHAAFSAYIIAVCTQRSLHPAFRACCVSLWCWVSACFAGQ